MFTWQGRFNTLCAAERTLRREATLCLPETRSDNTDDEVRQDRLGNKLAEPVDRPMVRRIFVQGQMCSAFVVIAGVGRRDPAQMALAEDDGMIEALPADRAD